ncbi:60S ribosomal protein L2, mitochondrial-like [Panicum miliaceum]|uniref:60S ribosomal protein L2, mitochondrial-like n=1 Tax=Panicum miliaceum TaxID=4540 RepID=A0A3L6PD13_PANMI|nr:60S ribosomal protein L2, mitochondrial-like [Panicum miliaceum]
MVGALKRLTLSSSKTAGRNSAGRRGCRGKSMSSGGPPPWVGIVERIEYDPNRSSSIALVRWVQGVHFRGHRIPQEPSNKSQTLESTTADVSGRFSLATLSGREYKGKEASSALYSSLGNGDFHL